MPWHNGPTLLKYLETVNISGSVPETGFYLPVQRVCRPNHTFRGFQGQIESGSVRVGDMLTALPSGQIVLVKSIHITDEEVDTAAAGQPVTIQLDREVDVSRGCVLTRNAGLKTAKEFSAALLWMDDAKLIPGQDYWAKIGTKLLPAIITGIRHKLDVNSGKYLPADVIEKNEIVACEIVLSEPVVLDRFKLHKTAGELILIDRVSHATAACGVVESVGERLRDGTFLFDGEKKFAITLFDGFYYHPDIHTVLRHSPAPVAYQKGDQLPLQTAAWNYPPNFDLTNGNEIVHIRNGRFAGFGEREIEYPLLESNGLESGVNPPRDFTKYRKLGVWEKDYEI
jgi:sulfate adenylyltransferase subunit 1